MLYKCLKLTFIISSHHTPVKRGMELQYGEMALLRLDGRIGCAEGRTVKMMAPAAAKSADAGGYGFYYP